MAAYLSIFLLALFAQVSSADNCRAVDYTQELGPTRHQAETGWCYAHTAADLVSQHLKTRVSAVDLATTYLLTDLNKVKAMPSQTIRRWLAGQPQFYGRTEYWRQEDPQAYRPNRILTDHGLYYLGGMDQDAILMSNIKGFCSDQELPGGPAEFKQHLARVKELARDRRWSANCLRSSLKDSPAIGSIANPRAARLARLFQCYVDQSCQERIQSREPILAASLDLAASLADFRAGIEAGSIDQGKGHAKLFAKINELLDQGKIVSIGWDAAEVYQNQAESDHAATLVARKKIGGVCHYQIRDNYGAKCYDMHKEFSAKCDPRNGGIWVRADQLASAYAAVWIK